MKYMWIEYLVRSPLPGTSAFAEWKATYWMNHFNKLLILDLDNNRYFRTNGIIISLGSDFTFAELHLRHYIWNWQCLWKMLKRKISRKSRKIKLPKLQVLHTYSLCKEIFSRWSERERKIGKKRIISLALLYCYVSKRINVPAITSRHCLPSR